ncbi:type IV secretion system protein, partial [Rummeliibacillus stabekisii]|nr:type IV secretion system protein [Rummeliibacillus stabekisii]
MLDLGEKIWDIFESLAESALNSFLKFFEIDTLKSLVFGRPNTRTELVWATFQENELTQAFSPIFNTMTTIAGFALVIFIIFAGMRFSSSSLMASRRNEFFESAKDLIFVVLLLYNLPLIYDLLFEINSAFLNIFSSAYDSPLGEFKKSYKKNGILGWIVIQLVLLGLGIWANFFYLMRKVTLVILMGIGPIMVVCWMFPRWKGITQAWFKELTGTIFIQTIHAFVFWTIAIFSKSTDGFIASVIVYIIFIPLTEQLRRLVGMGGDTTNVLSKAGSMMGLAALGGMAGAVKGAMDGKSVMSSLKGAYRGTKDGKGNGSDASGEGVDDKGKAMAASAGSDIGTTSRAERMLKPGDVVSRMGKAVIGAAGAIAGSATGPVGTMIGAEAGAMAGAAAGGLAGRVGGAAVQGLASRLQAGKNAVSDLNKAREQDFDEGMATLLAENDTNKWATDNKEAIMNDLKQKFPDATDKELNEKFNEVKAQKKEALMGKAKGQWADAKKVSGKVANGNQLVDASSSAMAQKWAEDNREQFMDQYDKENPQKPGESASDFATRRMNAFNKKVDSMKDHFAAAGKEYTNQFGGNSPVSREGFNNHMAASVKGLKDAGNVANLASASASAVANLASASASAVANLASASASAVANVERPDLFTSKGIPNSDVLANSLAHVKTK